MNARIECSSRCWYTLPSIIAAVSCHAIPYHTHSLYTACLCYISLCMSIDKCRDCLVGVQYPCDTMVDARWLYVLAIWWGAGHAAVSWYKSIIMDSINRTRRCRVRIFSIATIILFLFDWSVVCFNYCFLYSIWCSCWLLIFGVSYIVKAICS